MTDYRFPAPGTDNRFPGGGVDNYFDNGGRFVGGVDLRFTAPGIGVPPGPALSSATINGTSLALTFSEAMKTTDLPAGSAFSVLCNGVSRTVSSLSASGSVVTLVLAVGAAFGETVTVAYTDPTAGNDTNALQAVDGRDVASFGPSAVTNETPDASSYAVLLAAIPNKTMVFDSRSSSASAGTTLTSSPWDNDVSATDATGNATWQTGVFGSARGVLADASGERVSIGLAGSVLFPVLRSFTFFAVEQRSGIQGGGTQQADNSQILATDAGAFSIGFVASSRQFALETFSGGFSQSFSGLSFTDGTPYVIAVRLKSDGAVRFNRSGTVANFPSAGIPMTSRSGQFSLNNWVAGTNYIGAAILTSTEMSDADMDAFVAALKTEYGIV